MLTDPCELQKATVARNKVHRGEAEPTEVMISLPEFYLQQLGENDGTYGRFQGNIILGGSSHLL